MPLFAASRFATLWALVVPYLLPFGHSSLQLRRSFKAAISTTICFALTCITPVQLRLGKNSSYCAMLSVPLNPGRRLGGMVQVEILALFGLGAGVSFGVLAHFLAQRVYYATGSLQRGFGVIIVFELALLAAVGYIKSAAPRLFTFNFVFFMMAHFMMLDSLARPAREMAHDYAVPALVTVAVSALVNLVVLPEFGSTYLGSAVYDNVHELQVLLSSAAFFFLGLQDDDDELHPGKVHFGGLVGELRFLVAQKKRLRDGLSLCTAAMLESSYEISYSYMNPTEMKPVVDVLQRISTSTNALVTSCELALGIFAGPGSDPASAGGPSKYALAEKMDRQISKLRAHLQEKKHTMSPQQHAFNKELLLTFIRTVHEPVYQVTQLALEATNYAKCIIAHAYDVDIAATSGLFSVTTGPTFVPLNKKLRASIYELSLEKIDALVEDLGAANTAFESLVRAELGRVADTDLDLIYLIPQEEYFVLSLFILNFKETSVMVAEILRSARALLALRLRREARGVLRGRRLWFSILDVFANWGQYLSLGSDEPPEGDEAKIIETLQRGVRILAQGSKKRRQRRPTSSSRSSTTSSKYRGPAVLMRMPTALAAWTRAQALLLAAYEWSRRNSTHLCNALRLMLAVFLVSFPGYSASMSQWYRGMRGNWIGFAAFVALESNVGATLFVGCIRTLTVAIGSAWGYALYVAGGGGSNAYLMCALAFLGCLPMFYFQLFSSYGRAGIIGNISLIVVPLSTLTAGPGPASAILHNFAKRCVSILIGGSAAALANTVFFPQFARAQLGAQLVRALQGCQLVQAQLAVGLGGDQTAPAARLQSDVFARHWARAYRALETAETLVRIARRELPVWGSFRTPAKIYTEIIFVLRQILEQFYNMKFLRENYGYFGLDEWGSKRVVNYRRETMVTLVMQLRTAEESLASEEPVPGHVPSVRVAHTRLVNSVRAHLLNQFASKIRETERLVQHRALALHGARNAEADFTDSSDSEYEETSSALGHEISRDGNELLMEQYQMLKSKYMCWSACAVSLEEVIVYVEELLHLAKFLVGVQQSASFTYVPAYQDWADKVDRDFDSQIAGYTEEEEEEEEGEQGEGIVTSSFGVSTGMSPFATGQVGVPIVAVTDVDAGAETVPFHGRCHSMFSPTQEPGELNAGSPSPEVIPFYGRRRSTFSPIQEPGEPGAGPEIVPFYGRRRSTFNPLQEPREVDSAGPAPPAPPAPPAQRGSRSSWRYSNIPGEGEFPMVLKIITSRRNMG